MRVSETKEADNVDGDDDERRLNALDIQKIERIFDGFCSFCLTASMMSILMGVVPLYSFGLKQEVHQSSSGHGLYVDV